MLITKAPPAAPMTFPQGAGELIFKTQDPANQPCIVTLSGSSGFELSLFEITAMGYITPNQPGTLELVLLAMANDPAKAFIPGQIYPQFTAIAHSPAEAVGATPTQWMIQGRRLSYFLASGKMQGEWSCNIADHPTAAIDLSNDLLGIKRNADPVIRFGLSAIFTPTTPPITQPYPVLTLASLTISSDN